MFLRSLHAPLTAIRGVGSASLPLFARLGITDISDLLCHYPREWEDLSKKVPIKDYRTGRVCTDVTVVAKDWIGYGRMKTLKIFIEDESGGAVLLCFNRNWMEKDFVQGRRFRVWGRFFYKYGEIQSSAFEYEALDTDGGGSAAGGFGQILPVYPLTAGIKMKKMRSVMKQALDRYAAALENELPAEIIERDAVMPKAHAIRAVHFPSSWVELEQAKKAIIYEELFYLEL
ncbi:MAG: ATP-dependent DNA helicase RecG, partial [Treponema sp.]|nr:ATP-dependent DNA helicase RecG [Treponema sp.]